MDVRRAVFAMLFQREFLGKLRLPVFVNAVGFTAIVVVGWFWLQPAFQQSFQSHPDRTAYDGPHLWLIAVAMAAIPAVLDALGGWAQDPIRRATEQHMLGATPTTPPGPGVSWLDRLQMLLLVCITTLMMMALVLIPWIGPIATIALGSAMAAIVWLQPPQAVRGFGLRARIMTLRRNPWRSLGTGFGLLVAMFFPFVNLLALLPVATISATSAYLHFDKRPTTQTPPADAAQSQVM